MCYLELEGLGVNPALCRDVCIHLVLRLIGALILMKLLWKN